MVALVLSCHRESKFSWFNTSGCPTELALPTSSFRILITVKTKNKKLDVRFVAAYRPTSPLEHVEHGKEASTGSVCGRVQQQRQAERQR